VIQDNLGSEGYEIDVAADGACAIKPDPGGMPDLVILDLTLPDCDGLDLLPILRLGGQIANNNSDSPHSAGGKKLSGLHLGPMTTLQNRLIWRNYWRAFVRCFGAHGPASAVYAWGP